MIKKFGFLVVLCSSFLFFSPNVKAAEIQELTTDELDYLYNELGFTEGQIKSLPASHLKDFVAGKAEIVSSFNEIYTFDEGTTTTTNEEGASTYAIPTGDLSFTGNILKINSSDVAGYDKFYAYSSFRWLKHPTWNLTDKIAIGFPTSLGIYFKTSGGNIVGHYSSTSMYNKSTGGTTLLASSTKPDTWEPGGGVASAHDLRSTLNASQFNEGTVTQYFYVSSALSGSANVQFQYGHKQFSGAVGISLGGGSVGLSITPSSTTEIRTYASSFKY